MWVQGRDQHLQEASSGGQVTGVVVFGPPNENSGAVTIVPDKV